MNKNLRYLIAAAMTIGSAATSLAQGDCGALVDALVKKKILTAQEGEEVRADLLKENATTTAGKLNLSNSITELKLYGDVRLRNQYENLDGQTTVNTHGVQQDRLRFRRRLAADVKLGEHWFGGFGLQTNNAADSANQTFGSAFQNYGIYIDRAYAGWKNDWLMAEGGKFVNPF
jgi:polyhydroxyalkanoate synthesis regulator phasin